MAQPMASLTVQVLGETHVLELRRIDFVRAEQALQKPVTSMDTLTSIYELAWLKLRRLNVAGIPDSFDAFLDLDPDVDADFDQDDDAGGKASGGEAPTGL
jgi:hypothetical protein